VRKALTGLGRDPRRAPTIVKTGPVYDLDQLIAQAEQVTSRLYDLEGRLCPRYPSLESTSSRVPKVYPFAQTTNHVYEKVQHHDGRLPRRNAYGSARERRQEIAESPHYCHDSITS
jgi:hypothetical protein